MRKINESYFKGISTEDETSEINPNDIDSPELYEYNIHIVMYLSSTYLIHLNRENTKKYSVYMKKLVAILDASSLIDNYNISLKANPVNMRQRWGGVTHQDALKYASVTVREYDDILWNIAKSPQFAQSQVFFEFDINVNFTKNGKFRDYVALITKVWRHFVIQPMSLNEFVIERNSEDDGDYSELKGREKRPLFYTIRESWEWMFPGDKSLFDMTQREYEDKYISEYQDGRIELIKYLFKINGKNIFREYVVNLAGIMQNIAGNTERSFIISLEPKNPQYDSADRKSEFVKRYMFGALTESNREQLGVRGGTDVVEFLVISDEPHGPYVELDKEHSLLMRLCFISPDGRKYGFPETEENRINLERAKIQMEKMMNNFKNKD